MSERDTEIPEEQSREGVASAAVLMIVTILMSAAAGLARDMLYAWQFERATYAAFVMAFRVPDFVFILLAGGALRTGFVPVFTGLYERGAVAAAWRTFNACLAGLLLVAGCIIALGMLLVGPLAELVAGGKEFTPEQVTLCAKLMRIMFPAQLFFLLGGLLMGALNALRHFLWPAVGPILYNLVLIAGVLSLGRVFGVTGQAATVLVGALIGSLVLQTWALRRRGATIRPRLDLRDEGLRQVLALVLPIIFGLAVPEINRIIIMRFSTDISETGPRILYFADHVVLLVVRAFGGGMAIALYPTLAALSATAKPEQFRRAVSFGLRSVLFLSIPAIALVVTLREPVVRLLFERGEFTGDDTACLCRVLVWYAIGAVPFAIQGILARAFYAMRDARTPLYVGIVVVIVTLTGGRVLAKAFALEGCAMAWSLPPVLYVTLLLAVLSKRCGGIQGARMSVTLGKTALASALAAGAGWGVLVALGRAYGEGVTGELLCAVVPAASGGAVFLAAGWLLRIEELGLAREAFQRRLRRTPQSEAREGQ
jgi:putative peptidoglycan lipid II flippase